MLKTEYWIYPIDDQPTTGSYTFLNGYNLVDEGSTKLVSRDEFYSLALKLDYDVALVEVLVNEDDENLSKQVIEIA
jgi:hypothetical protein